MFAGMNIFITGAGGGIGAELVKNFARQESANVYATDIDQAALANLSAESKKYGTKIETLRLDVTQTSDIENLLSKMREKKIPIDMWINNAGISRIGDFSKLSLADLESVMRVNFFGTLNCSKLVLAEMEENSRGTLVNIASVAGHVPCAYMSTYCAAKHAVVGFTRALQSELQMKHSPLRTVLVSPGFVDTAIIKRGEAMGFPDWLKFLLSSPQTAARDIIKGLKKGEAEIFPTISGKMMLTMHRWLPKSTQRSSKILLAKSFKDFMLGRFEL